MSKVDEITQETERSLQMAGLSTVKDFNRAVEAGGATDIINVCEAFQTKGFVHMADDIAARGARVVLLAGPSSSGKTTTAKRLSLHLAADWVTPVPISMDDYFVNRADTPRDADGNYDFEHVEAVDLELFNRDINALLAGEEIELPRYDFLRGEREYTGRRVHIDERSVLVIEGIHALNPMLTANIPDSTKFRIYASPLIRFRLDETTALHRTDTRLLRRILRDSRTRGHSALQTIEQWPSVRRGEERWIFPFAEHADVMFNSSLLFELSALRPHLEPLLQSVRGNAEGERLLDIISRFAPIGDTQIPPTSLLREFLGGSSFTY